jgi:hypothetical protein
MVNRYIRALVCVAALTVGLQITQAQAQQTPQSPQQPAQQQSSVASAATETVTSADITEQEVEQFAKSYDDVSKIQKDTEKQLESVQDSAGVAQVKQEANQKMADAVQGHGLKVERFNTIARSLSQDATLKQRIQQKLQELR